MLSYEPRPLLKRPEAAPLAVPRHCPEIAVVEDAVPGLQQPAVSAPTLGKPRG
jgi:hypothetical protein